MKPLLNRAQTTITATLPPILLLHTPSDCQAIPSREDRSGSHDNTKRPRRQCIGIRSALTLEPKNKKNEATRKRFRRIRYTLRLTSDHLVLLPQNTRNDLLEPVALGSCPLFRVLRHRIPSSPLCIPEVIRKPFALSRVFLLFSRGKSAILVKKKASSRSGILLSIHVVLKTRHINPNIHVRRY